MSKQANQIAAHRVAMNGRGRMSFGRTFLATLREGKNHHDAGKLSAFIVAAGVATAKQLKSLAAKGQVTLETLNDVAHGIVTLLPADQLPVRTNLQ
jgi:hypothetical protein